MTFPQHDSRGRRRKRGGLMLSLNLLLHSHPLRVLKLQLRPPRIWKPEPDEPVTSALHGWSSQTLGPWQQPPSSVPSWRACRVRMRECLLSLSSSHWGAEVATVTLPSPAGSLPPNLQKYITNSQSGPCASPALPFPSPEGWSIWVTLPWPGQLQAWASVIRCFLSELKHSLYVAMLICL